jgi:hypothetical protein
MRTLATHGGETSSILPREEGVPYDHQRIGDDEICPYCVDRTPEGPPDGPPCEIDGELCCIFQHLDNMVKAVVSTSDSDVRPYIRMTRQVVCSACDHQDPSGFCPQRVETLCALNNYLPLVVEAIEDVQYGELSTGKE